MAKYNFTLKGVEVPFKSESIVIEDLTISTEISADEVRVNAASISSILESIRKFAREINDIPHKKFIECDSTVSYDNFIKAVAKEVIKDISANKKEAEESE